MATRLLDAIDFTQIPSINFAVPELTADPAGYVAGMIWNSTEKLLKYHDGTSWVVVANYAIIDNKIVLHKAEADPHPQYLLQTEGDALYVNTSGDTMTNPLAGPNPVADNHYVTKAYVDEVVKLRNMDRQVTWGGVAGVPTAGQVIVITGAADARTLLISDHDSEGTAINLAPALPGDNITLSDLVDAPPVIGFVRFALTAVPTRTGAYWTCPAIRTDTTGTITNPAIGTALRMILSLASGNVGGVSPTEADARYVNTAGDAMTGLLTLSGPPTAPLNPATKQYTDDTTLHEIWQTGTPPAGGVNKRWIDTSKATAPPAMYWKQWQGTQAAYDAIATKDPLTLYVII